MQENLSDEAMDLYVRHLRERRFETFTKKKCHDGNSQTPLRVQGPTFPKALALRLESDHKFAGSPSHHGLENLRR